MLRDSGTILDYDNHAGASAQYFLPLHDAHFNISSVDVVETSTYLEARTHFIRILR